MDNLEKELRVLGKVLGLKAVRWHLDSIELMTKTGKVVTFRAMFQQDEDDSDIEWTEITWSIDQPEAGFIFISDGNQEEED